MELQGKKATYDFLSLYNKDSSFLQQDPRPPSQGLFLKTHDFLKPLERADKGHRDKVASGGVAVGRVDRAASVEHVLPGGIGTYSVSHVSDTVPLALVKPDRGTCRGVDVIRKPDGVSYGCPYNAAVPLMMWDESVEKVPQSRGQWPSPFTARGSLSASRVGESFGGWAAGGRNNPALEKKQFMESASRSSKGFDDDEEEEEEESGRREGSSSHRELTVKVDGKIGGDNDQRPSTPRSKHSATEQRRRSKINDRFQILRELIPHTDQKRDKASFLLEVIEYIRFLQEKVQKYESPYLGWNQDNAKLIPWNNNQSTGSGISDPFQVTKNGSTSPGYMFSGNDNGTPVAPATLSTAQNLTESDMAAGVSYKAMETPANIANADNMTTQAQPQWLRSAGPAGCSVSREILNEPEELTIDEGTISVSSAYSQGLLTALALALQNSGMDLSQASISVQINLGKRAINKRLAATLTTSNAKDHEDPGSTNQAMVHCRMGSNAEEPSQAPKRRKKNNY